MDQPRIMHAAQRADMRCMLNLDPVYSAGPQVAAWSTLPMPAPGYMQHTVCYKPDLRFTGVNSSLLVECLSFH